LSTLVLLILSCANAIFGVRMAYDGDYLKGIFFVLLAMYLRPMRSSKGE